MADFWDTVKDTGTGALAAVLTPISNGIGKTFGNLVLGAQNKVADATNRVTNSTDPMKKANTPAQDATSAANLKLIASTKSNLGIVLAALVVVLVVYYFSRGRR